VRALITGVSGFAGSHLADFLLQQGLEVWGVANTGLGAASHLEGQVSYRSLDLRDPAAVYPFLKACQPARIYHLAAQAFVPASWKDPWPTLETNIRSELNLLQGIVDLKLDARILCVSSGEIYGKISSEMLPVDEQTPLSPDSPYGVSKVAQDLLAAQYYLSNEVYAVRARPFNHIGPRQNERFVAPEFARQIAEIEAGRSDPVMLVGNLEAQRDFSDVRDMVRAYYLLLEQGAPGEAYNIGRGEPHSVRELLEGLLSFSTLEIDVQTDPARFRPSDVPVSYADISKIRTATGWEPRISFRESLGDVLGDWRERVKRDTRYGMRDAR
jgi:GDP-4-dehydro-6-deoxy-D-mannose reductase